MLFEESMPNWWQHARTALRCAALHFLPDKADILPFSLSDQIYSLYFILDLLYSAVDYNKVVGEASFYPKKDIAKEVNDETTLRTKAK